MTKRFYETDSKLTGLKVIIDRQGEYTFSPLTHEQNHMFLKALNNLDSNSFKGFISDLCEDGFRQGLIAEEQMSLESTRRDHDLKRHQHNSVRKSLGMPPVIGTPRDERW